MRRIRVIPVLLLANRQLVKSVQFKNITYVGDCENVLKIFSEKGVDELVILDINAWEKETPDYELITNLVSECFMPLAYGGAITNMEQAKKLFSIGIEKVVLGRAAWRNKALITDLAKHYGSQSVVVCLDVREDWLGRKRVYVENGKRNTGVDPIAFAIEAERLGAGEVILQSINRDGTSMGYDINLIGNVAGKLQIPLIALGGASGLTDFVSAVNDGGASAVAAGSMFVFRGVHRAVLISYPSSATLQEEFFSKINT